jgi:hypothetical protein
LVDSKFEEGSTLGFGSFKMPILKDLKGSNRDNLIRINLDSIT